jgi:hypothetical protein
MTCSGHGIVARLKLHHCMLRSSQGFAEVCGTQFRGSCQPSRPEVDSTSVSGWTSSPVHVIGGQPATYGAVDASRTGRQDGRTGRRWGAHRDEECSEVILESMTSSFTVVDTQRSPPILLSLNRTELQTTSSITVIAPYYYGISAFPHLICLTLRIRII